MKVGWVLVALLAAVVGTLALSQPDLQTQDTIDAPQTWQDVERLHPLGRDKNTGGKEEQEEGDGGRRVKVRGGAKRRRRLRKRPRTTTVEPPAGEESTQEREAPVRRRPGKRRRRPEEGPRPIPHGFVSPPDHDKEQSQKLLVVSAPEQDTTFDRKKLFPESSKLPPTSAIIRRRLRPNNSTFELRTNLLPQGYDKAQPEVIPKDKIIEMMRTTEEPNYPKRVRSTTERPTEPKSKIATSEEDVKPNYPRSNRTVIPEVRQTPKPEAIKPHVRPKPAQEPSFVPKIIKNQKTVQDIYKLGHVPTSTPQSTQSFYQEQLERLNGTVEDHILDLLMTENSSNKLAAILELRNMTLVQLIQHRQRGSSQLHFDVFEKKETKEPEGNVIKEEESDDAREARVWDGGIPEGTPPSWKVIPNPRLTPVSTRGVYQEISLSGVPTRSIPDVELDPDGLPFQRLPPGVRSAVIVSGGILGVAVIGFLSVLVSCRVRQRNRRLRAKEDVLCRREEPPAQAAYPVFSHGIPSNTTSNRHYYLWRTLRKTFQYD